MPINQLNSRCRRRWASEEASRGDVVLIIDYASMHDSTRYISDTRPCFDEYLPASRARAQSVPATSSLLLASRQDTHDRRALFIALAPGADTITHLI